MTRTFHPGDAANAAGNDPAEATVWRLHQETVLPEWVDYNGHMNVAFYVLIFDHATDAVLDRLDIGADYRQRSGCSIFVAEAHVTYEQEVREGQTVMVDSRVIGFDGKRLIIYHEMSAPDVDGVIASNEVLCLHVDLEARRSAPLPTDARDRIAAVAASQATAGRPRRAGRAIGLDIRRVS